MSRWQIAMMIAGLGLTSPSFADSFSEQVDVRADLFELDQTGSYEDTAEFLYSDDPTLPDSGVLQASPTPSLNETEVLDPALDPKAKWSYQFVYFPKVGEPTLITQYQIQEAVKPASLLKIFTGWMAYEKKAITMNNLSFMLQTSNNPLADATFRRLGAQKSFKSFFQKELETPLDASTAKIYNGSGLPVYINGRKYNSWMKGYLIPELLHRILQNEDYDRFKTTLASPGQRGTLRSRFNDFQTFPIYAKTGTLNRVANLAGYVELKYGTVVFTVTSDELPNLTLGREQIDQLVMHHTGIAERMEQFAELLWNPSRWFLMN